MEIISTLSDNMPRLRAVLFDFDGTISTLRQGWEGVMIPFMLEMIAGPTAVDEKLIYEVQEYVNQSTGIQTIFQMKWLVETVKIHGRNPGVSEDPWWYKEEYNRRLMKSVQKRKAGIARGKKQPLDYMVLGSEKFLEELMQRGIEMYVASGTDHPDVVQEVETLGLTKYFTEIAGAPPGKEDCSKGAVLKRLIEERQLAGPEVVVVGDGKVEISLGREVNARTLGVASDEVRLYGVNPAKRERLIIAGAHAITGDFGNIDEILDWLKL